MRFVFASYVLTKEYNEPEAWLRRISMYTGILESLSKEHEVTSIEQIDHEGEHISNGVRYIFKKFSKAGRKFPWILHSFIKKQQPDVVVIQGLHFPLQVIQLRQKLGPNTAIILHHHAEKPFTGIKKYAQLWASRHVDAYVFASRDMGMDWVKKGNISDTKRIHEAMEVSSVFYTVDKEKAKAITEVNGTPVFLWVGRLNDNKDPLCVVRAFLRYAVTEPAARLYMIYQTEELLPQIKTLLNSHPSKDAVVLVGAIENEELLYWYNSADFIVSGSHYEGSGTAIAEAMSCGCVPVVTDIASFRMITNNGKCGVLYQAGNDAALLTALTLLKKMDVSQRSKLCLDYFRSNLSFDAIADKFEQIAHALHH